MTKATSQHGSSRFAFASWVLAFVALACGYVAFREGVDFSARWIWDRPEYGHGLIIPFISAYLAWQRRGEIAEVPINGAWIGVLVIALAAVVNLVGQLSALFIIQQYAALLAFYGLVISFVGVEIAKKLTAPLLLLIFMIPLPEFLYQNISAQLQLISSQIGVALIRLLGISVYVEGNVIDLGVYKLQVAEACDGLRYLFPLMTLGFIVAYFFRAPFWKRVLLFVSSVPITIFMNSFRIGVIGLMVDRWGIAMAEGFLHEFQGWAVFMVSLALLLAEMIVLASVGRGRAPWRSQISFEIGAPVAQTSKLTRRKVRVQQLAAVALLTGCTVVTLALPERTDLVPPREPFSKFPMALEGWHGRLEPLQAVHVDALDLDDYLLANFSKESSRPVNLYVAWYQSQRAGASAHSPRSCIPGGGWRIVDFRQESLEGVLVAGKQVRANRVLIQLGTQQQLVYYWFQQRGRVITNEYAVKWLMFWDSLTKSRSDGALVRLTVPLDTSSSADVADAELREFASAAISRIEAFVPN